MYGISHQQQPKRGHNQTGFLSVLLRKIIRLYPILLGEALPYYTKASQLATSVIP